MKSVMKHQFSQIPRVEIPRSVFDRSHGYKTTFDAGYLIPFYADEALPGDTFRARTSLFARMATPILPVMDNLFMETFYFAVPIRLLWDNWQKFCGEQIDPDDSTDFLAPQITLAEGSPVTAQTLADYMGIPIGVDPISFSALHFRAYNLIWNEWFRDQNLQDSVTVNRDDGPDAMSDYTLLRRGKRHDYFTSALPWPQKGPGVELPLGTEAPVVGNGYSLGLTDGTNHRGLFAFLEGGSSFGALGQSLQHNDVANGSAPTPVNMTTGNKAMGVATEPSNSNLIADLSSATAATINSLRQAFQLQRLYERDARGGTRYTEIVRSHFGVISPDARLQRPEYLGGSSVRININPVQQTSETGSTPLGNLAAYGLATDNSGGFTKSFTEHCIILGFVNVRADLTYQQGLPRMWSRRTRWDYYWPALAHLGEQEIYNKEIMYQGTSADGQIFGYQERWAEYRYFPSQITGKFRSQYATPLDAWHLSQEFATLPALNASFIEDNPPIDRVIAVPAEPHFLFDSHMELHCARPMPVYSVPGLIDHF